jgi:hypothetical protein
MPLRHGILYIERRNGKKIKGGKEMKISKWAENIEVHEWEDGKTFSVTYKSNYGTGVRLFGSKELAERFARGEEIVWAEHKKGRKVEICPETEKHEQFENWTERENGREVTTEPIVGYHFGFEGKKLAAVETCFYFEIRDDRTEIPTGTIMVEFPAGTEITKYGDDEFRVVLDPSFTAWRLKPGWRTEK